jgi:F-type H+-transporting ATPase subunit epsilon
MPESRMLEVSLISPAGVGYEGEARSLVVPAYDGKLGILYGHAPMMVLLGEGELRLRSDAGLRRFHVARGFLQVVENKVTVLAEEVSVPEEAEGRDEG